MRHLAGIEHDRAAESSGQPGQVDRPGAHVVVYAGAQDLDRFSVIAVELRQGPGEPSAEVRGGPVSLVAPGPRAGRVAVLRGVAQRPGV